MSALAVLLFSYLVGSIPFGLIVGKLWRSLDVRQYGSGNIGTSNVMRTIGRVPAVLVLVLDVLKGFLPVWISLYLALPSTVVIATAVLAVAGHIWSLFLGFRGGKGIATMLGVMIALNWGAAILLVIVWLAVLLLFRYISLASLSASVALPISLWLIGHPVEWILGGLILCSFAFWRHRSNLRRLRSGSEYRFGERARRVEGQ